MPHRLTTIRRFRISDDILISILQKLDPTTLYRACKVFRRLYVIVNEYQPLRYQFELALSGMKDGPVSYAHKSSISRLQLLLSYRTAWPALAWIHENKFKVMSTALPRVSGGFLSYTGSEVIDLMELPSARVGRPPAKTRHLRYQIAPNSQMECIAVDPSQNLVITSESFFIPGGYVVLKIGIRNLSTFGQHEKTPGAFYEFNTQGINAVTSVSAVVCGSKLAVSLQLEGIKSKHLLMDWRSFQAAIFDEQDVHFLNENQLLVARNYRGSPRLHLYNISNVAKVIHEREYELPDVWAHSILSFARNAAPASDLAASPSALFYSDPSARILLLTATPRNQDGTAATGMGSNWLFINESYFRAPSRKEYRSLPWAYWGQCCMIRDIAALQFVGIPRIIGTRVIYPEWEPIRASQGTAAGGRMRLHIINFTPYRDAAPPRSAWSMVGQHSPLTPSEAYREVPSATSEGIKVDDIFVTEDNIVLLSITHRNVKSINILTFGVNHHQMHGLLQM